MDHSERRSAQPHSSRELRQELSEAQRDTLGELERYGWELKFIRHPLFQDIVPVVFDPDRNHFAVIRADGTLDENPGFDIRG